MDNKQTNNILYEKKHHYMLILKELTTLKNRTDYEVLNEGLSKVYSEEIHDLYTRTIVGLLEEGVKYQYIKDSQDSKKDKIKLYIDGNTYECRNIDIREILEDRYEEVMNTKYNGPSMKDIQSSRLNNKDPQLKKDKQSEEVKNILLGIKDAINENKPVEEKIIVKDENLPPMVYLAPGAETKIPVKNQKKHRLLLQILSTIFFIIITGSIIWGCIEFIPGLKNNIETSFDELKESDKTEASDEGNKENDKKNDKEAANESDSGK